MEIIKRDINCDLSDNHYEFQKLSKIEKPYILIDKDNINFYFNAKPWKGYSDLEISRAEKYLTELDKISLDYRDNCYRFKKSSLIFSIVWQYVLLEEYKEKSWGSKNPLLGKILNFQDQYLEKKEWSWERRSSFSLKKILEYLNKEINIPIPKIYFNFNNTKIEVIDAKEKNNFPGVILFFKEINELSKNI